jgi:hypothetical protein
VEPGSDFASRPRRARTIAVVDGAPPAQVRAVIEDGPPCEPHPRGTLIAGDPGLADEAVAEQLAVTVYTVVYNPHLRELFCYERRRGRPTRCFATVPIANTDLYEMVDAVLGETTPDGICRALAIDPALLGM